MNNQVSIRELLPIESLIQLISASIKIQNSSHIHSQGALIDAFISTVTFDNSTVSDLTLRNSNMKIVGSTLELTNMTIANISNPDKVDFIVTSLGSSLLFTNVLYTDSNSVLFNLVSSKIEARNLTFKHINEANHLFKTFNSDSISIENIQTLNVSSSAISLISVRSTTNCSIAHSTFSSIDQLVFEITRSNRVSLINITVTDSQEAVRILRSNTVAITNSSFVSNRGSNSTNGGAVNFMNSRVSISDSEFINNSARQGAAIYFDCNLMSLCNLSVQNTLFRLNNATRMGGAIYYSFKRPDLPNIVFENNTAPYGPNLASYAVKIRRYEGTSDDILIDNVGAGIKYDKEIKLALLDYDNQVMVLNSVNEITIISSASNVTSVSGTNSVLQENGIGTFENLIVLGIHGSRGVKFQASSKAIDTSKITQVYGGPVSNNTVTVNFRECMPGEYIESSNQ